MAAFYPVHSSKRTCACHVRVVPSPHKRRESRDAYEYQAKSVASLSQMISTLRYEYLKIHK